MKITVLGAGLAGLSTSYHLGHEDCVVFEQNSHPGGLVHSEYKNGCYWDQGPHVSFTNNNYAQEIFAAGVDDSFYEYPVKVGNYMDENWIPHPAQSNLFAVPQPLRRECLESFLETRKKTGNESEPTDYGEWLEYAFGPVFARTFPAIYTRKYWTVSPEELTVDWIGNRVYTPNVEDVKNGYNERPTSSHHYIKTVRYPQQGGYFSFARKLAEGAKINFEKQVTSIDLSRQQICFTDSTTQGYERLVSTLPLPVFVKYAGAPADILAAAERLVCTSVLLVNVTANHSNKVPYHWFYVYDEDKLSTRVTNIGLLSPNNVPVGKTGLQVEVYTSSSRPLPGSFKEVAKIVCNELIEMGMIKEVETVHTRFILYANVVFERQRRENLDKVLNWLEQFGLERQDDDLDPMTDWSREEEGCEGSIILAGRHAQWKYYWSDDCVLRGRQLARHLD
jgi:protoporphyrinogen oxidase